MSKKKTKKFSKTNAMRILEDHDITYDVNEFEVKNKFISGYDLAVMNKQNPKQVFKTLVTRSKEGSNFVCIIPVGEVLDLKKAANLFLEKKLEMLPMKYLFNLTGYEHGGCSPVGMKKLFPTIIDDSALKFDNIYVSGGKVGLQICLSTKALVDITNASLGKITI